MRKALIFSMVFIAACSAKSDDGNIDIDPVSDIVGNWSSTLAAQNNSGITGTASVSSRAAGSKVTVHIMGAMSGATHPWHVHRGSCGNDRGIVGGASEYAPLQVGADGTAHRENDIPVALNEDDSYFVNVHKSPTELNVIVSCGALRH